MAKSVENTSSEYLEQKMMLARILHQARNVGFSQVLMYELESVLGKVSESSLLNYVLSEILPFFEDMKRRCDDYEHLKRIRFNIMFILQYLSPPPDPRGEVEWENYQTAHGV